MKKHLYKDTMKSLQMLGIIRQELLINLPTFIEKKCTEWDTKMCWTKNEKKTLEIFNEFKVQIKQESYYNEDRSLIYILIRYWMLRPSVILWFCPFAIGTTFPLSNFKTKHIF